MTIETPQLRVDTVVDAPGFQVVMQRRIPMVQIALRTIVVPQLLLDMVVNALIMQGRQNLRRGAEAVSHGLPDHRHSPVAGHVDRRPCFAGRAGRRFSCRGSHGPDFSSDHRVSQLAAQGMSLFAGRAGRSHPCRCAEAASHGPDCCRTKEIRQFIDTAADSPVVRVVQIIKCR